MRIYIIYVHDDSIMSYLIALYVYYHGNNLSVFGINKGARDEDLQNKGMKSVSEINPSLVDPKLLEDVKKREAQEAEAERILNYNEMMKEAQRMAQAESFKMHKAGVIDVGLFDNTPEAMIEDYDDGGEIPLDFFSSINNM